VTFKDENGLMVVLEVHSDGFCYNCDWNNKKAYPGNTYSEIPTILGICDEEVFSQPNILTYNYGSLQLFLDRIYYHQVRADVTQAEPSGDD